MKSYFAALPLLASLAAAGPVSAEKRDTTPLVELLLNITSIGNTGLEAALTNPGSSELKLFATGTILDSAPVEKVAVFNKGKPLPDQHNASRRLTRDRTDGRVPFDGVRLRIAPPELITNDAFQVIKPNQTVIMKFDFGQMHDLSPGGNYQVSAAGGIPYATGNSTKVEGYIPFKSNILTIKNVNGTQAAITRRDFHAESKRVVIQAGCTRAQNQAVNTALGNCATLASNASVAAMRDARRLNEYFKTTTLEARRNISITFQRVAKECTSRLKAVSVSSLYCTDVYNSCKEGVLAYTVPSLRYMVNCPLYFNALPPLTTTCHAQDQASTTLHEMTHLTQIRGTLDWGVYGYEAIKTLPSEKNLFHADTFCLFANCKSRPFET
ncbi:deuterolysin metalloprotease [Colletotrichum sojae]|uniref:Neutral protease 2 n=1 Tax=Colletotrichum sojae TaxID=2175907 RepID=A0A8H6JAL7_9PEZI|nr:deuterolysin metalloprotease [Colletotrichum sojae]